MSRIVLATVLILAGGSVARADKAATDEFQAFVTKMAADDNRTIEAWWSANLDGDPAMELVALLCSTGNSEPQGFFIVEKDAKHRYELSFDVDSRTHACQKKPDAPPKLESRSSKTIDVYQGHVDGHEETSYALRDGRLVIVHEVDASGKPGAKAKITDWDQIVKSKKKGAGYQSSDRIRELDGH